MLKKVKKFLSKNWYADLSALKNSFLAKVSLVWNFKKYLFIAIWYSVIFSLFFGFITSKYSIFMFLFSFSAFVIYEKLKDDIAEILFGLAKINHNQQ